MSVRFNKFSNGSELKVNMCVPFNHLLTIPVLKEIIPFLSSTLLTFVLQVIISLSCTFSNSVRYLGQVNERIHLKYGGLEEGFLCGHSLLEDLVVI
jgi:hypothetical protein